MDKQKIIDIINRFPELNILVIGDIMLDIYDFCYTKNSKILQSEKKGKRAYIIQDSIQVLGGAGNVALNLSSLQAITNIISISGNDSHYFSLIDCAEKHGINHIFIRDTNRTTTVKTRVYIDDKYQLRKDKETPHKISDEISRTIVSEFNKLINEIDAVILSDYNKGIFTNHNSKIIIDTCNKKDIPIIVDFKPPNIDLFSNATIISPNYYEAKEIHPKFEIGNNLDKSIIEIVSKLKCQQIIITLHDNGICGYDGKKSFHIEANKVDEIDAVGCGDTVRALLSLFIAAGLNLYDAANIANDGAGIVVTKPATSTLIPYDLIEFISKKY